MNKFQTLTLILLTFSVCTIFFVETPNVTAAGAFTNYYVGLMQTEYKVAMQNNLIIIAKDASNTTVNTYNGPITLTCSDPKAILPTSPQLTLANGAGSYVIYFGTAGTQTITVTDVSNNAVFTTISVNVAPIHFSISVNPTAITAGESVNVTVTALDASNNVLSTIGSSGYGSSVDFSSTDSQAQFPPQGAPSNLVNGVGVFNITLLTPGSQTITVINKGFTLVNATTNPITVNAQPTPTPNATATPTPTPAATTSPTATALPTQNPTEIPLVTPTTTPQGQGTNGNLTIEIVLALVVIVIVAVVVTVIFLKKKSKNNLPPPPPPPPT